MQSALPPHDPPNFLQDTPHPRIQTKSAQLFPTHLLALLIEYQTKRQIFLPFKGLPPSLRFDDRFMRPNAAKISGVRVQPQRAVPGKGVKQVKQTVGVPSYHNGVSTPPPLPRASGKPHLIQQTFCQMTRPWNSFLTR
ncbi:hypothetical protein TNCV_2023001 [Trichonephila clavipes]|nr:hypothetical protein TNCV_2023001 [Trichonephila clavipes]